jgi:uncharacterized protein YjbI with pentapeptide repeats
VSISAVSISAVLISAVLISAVIFSHFNFRQFHFLRCHFQRNQFRRCHFRRCHFAPFPIFGLNFSSAFYFPEFSFFFAFQFKYFSIWGFLNVATKLTANVIGLGVRAGFQGTKLSTQH